MSLSKTFAIIFVLFYINKYYLFIFQAKGAHWYARYVWTYEVQFSVSLMRQNSNYPREVVDALMLAVKETAQDCKLDCFVEVFYLILSCKS